MAIHNQIDCNPVVGCVSAKSLSVLAASRQTTPPSRHSISTGVSAIIAAIIGTLAASYKRYQSRVALTRLSDPQLRDIGLERSDDGRINRRSA